jgi:GT2 family glycosyltransferase
MWRSLSRREKRSAAARLAADRRVLRKSGLFDAGFYRAQLRRRHIHHDDPILHYLTAGASAGFDPNPLFDGAWYLAQYEDARRSGLNPLLHYLRHGAAEGHEPGPDFCTAWFLERDSDARQRGANPLSAYLHPSGIVAPQSRVPAPEPPQVAAGSAPDDRRRKGRNRIAVFTVVTGGRDRLVVPTPLDPAFDYVCFSNRPISDLGVFEVRPITMHQRNPVRAALFVKTHPHLLLAGYDVAIWIEPGLVMRSDLAPAVARLESAGALLGADASSGCDCAYDEAYLCSRRRGDSLKIIAAQVARYRRAGMPAHAGLVDTDLMAWNLRHPRAGGFLNAWWREIKDGSQCDRIGLGHVLWRSGETALPLSTEEAGAGLASARLQPAPADPPNRELINPYEGVPYARLKAFRLAAHRDRTIDVIVCVHNALDDARLCLDSVAATLLPHHRLIVVDDGSGHETAAYLADFAAARSNVALHRHDHALGYTRAANAGLRLSAAEVVVLLNSDTIVTGDWLLKLADALHSAPGIGIAGPFSNAASLQSLPRVKGSGGQTAINPLPPGEDVASMDRHCEEWTHGTALPLVDIVHGFCYAMKREVIERIGLFDEAAFPIAFGEENDYSIRAADAGFLLAVATHTFVFHAKSKSYGAAGRAPLSLEGARTLERLHPGRMGQAIANKRHNPLLQRFRDLAQALFDRART